MAGVGIRRGRRAETEAEVQGIILGALEVASVRHAMEQITASPYFRNSKRYPAFLRYVVEHTLTGEHDVLKERTIGMSIFGRAPDYDTSNDPIVRIIAGEVRKRLSQYYEEAGNRVELKIHLAPGTYVPEFITAVQTTSASTLPTEPVRLGIHLQAARRVPMRTILSILAMLLVGGSLAIWWLHRPTGQSLLWGPLLKSTRPIVVTVGPPHTNLDPVEGDPSIIDHLSNPAVHVSLPSAMALSQTSGYLESHGRHFKVLSSSLTSLQDLNSQPAILIGGINNIWTMRFCAPLRFHFAGMPARIVDARDPQNKMWAIDLSKPYKSTDTDYALVALFRNQTTGAPVLIIAGVGPNATEAASRFLTSSDQISGLDGLVRSHPLETNVEVVLKVQSIEGQPGTASIVATHFW